MRPARILQAVVGSACIIIACGCGGENLQTISGQVTYQETPLERGVISFYATGRPPVSSGIDPTGKYEVAVPPGEYVVAIKSPPKLPEGVMEGDEAAARPPRNPFPLHYGRRRESGLTVTVMVEDDGAPVDFHLQ